METKQIYRYMFTSKKTSNTSFRQHVTYIISDYNQSNTI